MEARLRSISGVRDVRNWKEAMERKQVDGGYRRKKEVLSDIRMGEVPILTLLYCKQVRLVK